MEEEGRTLHKNWLEKETRAPGQRRKTTRSKQRILFGGEEAARGCKSN